MGMSFVITINNNFFPALLKKTFRLLCFTLRRYTDRKKTEMKSLTCVIWLYKYCFLLSLKERRLSSSFYLHLTNSRLMPYITLFWALAYTKTSWSEHESHTAIVESCFCNWNAMHTHAVLVSDMVTILLLSNGISFLLRFFVLKLRNFFSL